MKTIISIPSIMTVFLFTMIFTSLSYAECPNLLPKDYLFVTLEGREADKTPTFVPKGGGVAFSFNLKNENCIAKQVKINEFYAAHYAQDYNTFTIRFDVYDSNNKLVGKKSFNVNKQITQYQEIRDTSKQQKYSGTIDLSNNTKISKIDVFVTTGNWAAVINDLSISFTR
ncbi:MAG: hypothetical protein HQK96_19230 [Nitrospirae bacterium]|nr:hypothetical protein [Nitrospirota bacterium]